MRHEMRNQESCGAEGLLACILNVHGNSAEPSSYLHLDFYISLLQALDAVDIKIG